MDCKFFCSQDGSSAVLGMPDIDNLVVLAINCEEIGRHLTSDKNTDNSKGNCLCKKVIQTEGRKFESYKNKRQDAEAQSQHNADNITKSSIVTNPTVIGNNSNENSFSEKTINKYSNSFFSELIINENKSFASDQFRKDHMSAANAKQTSEIHINGNESLI